MLIEFNVNEYVKVRLTEKGWDELRRQHEELQAEFPSHKLSPIEMSLPADANGLVKFQLWDLMRRFGHMMRAGFIEPFATEIYFEKDSISFDSADRELEVVMPREEEEPEISRIVVDTVKGRDVLKGEDAKKVYEEIDRARHSGADWTIPIWVNNNMNTVEFKTAHIVAIAVEYKMKEEPQ